MEQFGLLRIDYASFDMEKFERVLGEFSHSEYSLNARDIDAPGVTHCVSAVRYIIREVTGWILPRYYIGDMCRGILDDKNISASIIPLDEGEVGDLIFFHGKSRVHRAYMIKHVGILLDQERFFHSAWKRGGVIDLIKERTSTGSIATCRNLTRYTDPRRK